MRDTCIRRTVFHGWMDSLLSSSLAKSHVLTSIPNLCYRCDNHQNKIENVCVLVGEPPTNPNQFPSDTLVVELAPFADPWEGILKPCFGCEEAGSHKYYDRRSFKYFDRASFISSCTAPERHGIIACCSQCSTNDDTKKRKEKKEKKKKKTTRKKDKTR